MLKRSFFIFIVISSILILGLSSLCFAQVSDTILVKVTVLSGTIPLAPPTGLAATPGDTAIDLSWNPNSEAGVTGYNIYRSQTQGDPYTQINIELIAQTSYQDTGLTNGTTYYYVVSAVDQSNNESGYSDEASAIPGDWITNLSVSPNAFSPNQDGNCDTATISYFITSDGSVTIGLYDVTDTLVRTLKENLPETAGINTAIWNGTDNDGNLLPDGTYTYKIDVVDTEANLAQQKQGTSTIDNHFMRITEPPEGSSLTGEVTFKALPSEYIRDPHRSYGSGAVTFYYRPKGATEWISMGAATEEGDGSWQIVWDSQTVGNGEYEFRLDTYYYDLNSQSRREHTLPYAPLYICHAGNYFAVSTLFSPNSDGVKDTTTIIVNFGQIANWTIAVKDASGTEIRSFEGTDKNIIQIWDGKNTEGMVVSDGIYTFNIRAIDPDTSEILLEGSGNLEVDNTPPTANITQPIADSEVSGSVEIRVIVDDLNYGGANSSLSWGQGESPSNWNMLVNFNSPMPTETILANWDTTSLTTGPYVLRLFASDLVGNSTEQKIPVNVYNLRIFSFSDMPDPFTPDGDGDKDTNAILATLAMPLDWTISIKDKDSILVRTFTGYGDSISQVWDGKDETGNLVEDGVYTYTIEANDPDTGATVEPVSGTITCDTALPIAQIISPQDDNILFGLVPIIGTASDNNLTSYRVEYGLGDSPSFWTLIKQSSALVIDGELAVWDTFSGFEDGIYTVRITVIDVANHVSLAFVKVDLDNIRIANVSISSVLIDPVNEEIVTISYTLDENTNLTFSIYDEATKNLVRTLRNNQAQSIGAYEVEWDGRDDYGYLLPMEAYYFAITAEDGTGRIGKYNDGTNPVYGSTPSSGNASVPPQGFDPYKNEILEVKYDLSHIGRMKIDVTGGILTDYEPRLAGTNIELWDGRDEADNIYNGPYSFYFAAPRALPRDVIILQNSILKITDLYTEAYLIVPSNSEVSSIYYTLSYGVNVMVTIEDPNGNHFRTLIDNRPQAEGDYALEWDGRDDDGKFGSLEGDYRVRITALDSTTGISASKIANIVVYKK